MRLMNMKHWCIRAKQGKLFRIGKVIYHAKLVIGNWVLSTK